METVELAATDSFTVNASGRAVTVRYEVEADGEVDVVVQDELAKIPILEQRVAELRHQLESDYSRHAEAICDRVAVVLAERLQGG